MIKEKNKQKKEKYLKTIKPNEIKNHNNKNNIYIFMLFL
jgi:hypothetical protein